MNNRNLKYMSVSKKQVPKPKTMVIFKKQPVSVADMMHVKDVQPTNLPIKLVKSQIISASRRTDIPAFYMPIVIEAIKRGYIEVTSPYGVKSNVSLSPVDVKCFVWWSKDYANWLQLYEIEKPFFNQYKHMFNFTLTGDEVLETGVRTTFEDRCKQLARLSQLFGPLAIKLRFDPIVIYYDKKGVLHNNLQHFEEVIKIAHELGITCVIFAFCISYGQVDRRMSKYGYTLPKLSVDEQKKILDPLLDTCSQYGVQLQTCCNSGLIGYRQISASKCVDGEIINQLCHNGLKTTRKDSGQRKECNCAVSRDIGSYTMICKHGCAYCYSRSTI